MSGGGTALLLNGAPHTTAARTVAELVAEVYPEGGGRHGVAVALDDAVVRRSAWEQTPLREGARVELIRAVGGG